MKSLLIGLAVIIIAWIGSSLIPSQSEVTENAYRIDTVEEHVVEMKDDIRSIKDFLMKGVCHD